MNRIVLTAAATVASAVAAVAIAAQPADATRSRVHTERYVLPLSTATTTFVGADERHPALGDRYIDSYQVRLHGHTVGHAYSDCTLVAGHSDADSVGQCLMTFVLRHGQVTSVGTPSNRPTSRTPLAGGTGRYAFSTGTATTHFTSGHAVLTLRYVVTR